MKKIYLLVGLFLSGLYSPQTLNAVISELNTLKGGKPAGFIELNGKIIFNAIDGYGREPRMFDPQTGTAIMLQDIRIYSDSSVHEQHVNLRIKYKDKIFFIASDSSGETQLWMTDGTTAGTKKVKTIRSNVDASGITFAATGDLLFFTVEQQLWVSDGTTAGTRKIEQFNNLAPKLVSLAGMVYFVANDGVSGSQLWKSDGTFDGTIVLDNLVTGGNKTNGTLLHRVDDRIVFLAQHSNGGSRLISTDGTAAGTFILANNMPDYGAKSAVMGKKLFFNKQRELWITDGTFNGTQRLRTLPSEPTRFDAAKSKLYISTSPGVWISDGTVNGTIEHPLTMSDKNYEVLWTSADSDNMLFAEQRSSRLYLNSGISRESSDTGISNYSRPLVAVEAGGSIYLDAFTSDLDYELFKINSETGTGTMIADINRTGSASPASFGILEGDLIFRAIDGYSRGFYKRDRSTGEIQRLSTTLEPQTYDLLDQEKLIKVGDYLYLRAKGVRRGVLRTAGTAETTEYVHDSALDGETIDVARLSDDQVAVFESGQSGGALYTLKNNENKFVKIKQLGRILPSKRAVNNQVYFIERDMQSSSIINIWKTQGTAESTEKFFSLPLVYDHSAFEFLESYGERLFFIKASGSQNIYGNELWVTDGAETTYMVKKFSSKYSILPFVHKIGDEFYFVIVSGADSVLYSFDVNSGTVAEVTKLTGADNSNSGASKSLACGEQFYFTLGAQLWKTNGTAAGTSRLLQHSDGIIDNIACVRNTLFVQFLEPYNFYKTDDNDDTRFFSINVTNGEPLKREHDRDITHQLVTDGERLFFAGYSVNSGSELYTITSPLPVNMAVNEPANGSRRAEIKIYPNPVADVVNLQLPTGHKPLKTEIFNTEGQMVKVEQRSDEAAINVSGLKAGMYIIRITTDLDTFTGRFIKM